MFGLLTDIINLGHHRHCHDSMDIFINDLFNICFPDW